MRMHSIARDERRNEKMQTHTFTCRQRLFDDYCENRYVSDQNRIKDKSFRRKYNNRTATLDILPVEVAYIHFFHSCCIQTESLSFTLYTHV